VYVRGPMSLMRNVRFSSSGQHAAEKGCCWSPESRGIVTRGQRSGNNGRIIQPYTGERKPLPGKNSAGKNYSRPAGEGKYIDWREAPEIFEGTYPPILGSGSSNMMEFFDLTKKNFFFEFFACEDRKNLCGGR
jgi:hypothetical protein